MDAGIAAVLGALAGSVATIGAALATGWAQREGARITARSEHRRERREPRFGAYKALIVEASGFRDHVGVFTEVLAIFPYGRIDEPFAERCEALADAVRERWVTVALVGPKEVAEIAALLERLSRSLVTQVVGVWLIIDTTGSAPGAPLSGRVEEAIIKDVTEFERGLGKFISLAQETMDDDGSLN